VSSAATKSDTQKRRKKSADALVALDSNHLTATAFDLVFMVWRRQGAASDLSY